MLHVRAGRSHLLFPLHLAALALLMLAAAGCARYKEPPDESYYTDGYVSLGLPAPGQGWTGDDMARAEKVLTSLADEGHRFLPRYQSPRSGEVFARLTTPENLDNFRDRRIPVNARFEQASAFAQANSQIFKLYVVGFMRKDVRDTDVVELMGAQLRLAVLLLDLVEEFLPTIDRNDPTYSVRMKGMQQMKQGLATVIGGSLITLTERKTYRASELVRFVGHMESTFPLIFPRLEPSSRADLLARLEKLNADSAMKDLQPGLGTVLANVKAALGDGKRQ